MISFDTNILVYATASVPDAKALRAMNDDPTEIGPCSLKTHIF